MPWLHILYAFLASAVIAFFTDWYFFGVLFHDRYGKTPAIWRRYQDKRDEVRSIASAQAIMAISQLLFVMVCAFLGLVTLGSCLLAALLLWIMIPVPLLVTNAIFIPMDRLIVLSHSLGWLVRLLITGLCASWLL